MFKKKSKRKINLKKDNSNLDHFNASSHSDMIVKGFLGHEGTISSDMTSTNCYQGLKLK